MKILPMIGKDVAMMGIIVKEMKGLLARECVGKVKVQMEKDADLKK